MGSGDLLVACDPQGPVGADMEFRARRLSTPPARRWVLCLSTDRPAVRLTRVEPAADGYVLDRDGVLGLMFPSTTTSVKIAVAPVEPGESEWQFWLDDGLFNPSEWTAPGV